MVRSRGSITWEKMIIHCPTKFGYFEMVTPYESSFVRGRFEVVIIVIII